MGVKQEIQLVNRKVTVGGTCDACGRPLELVFETRQEDTRQFTNASLVTMHGWYGGFIDPVQQEDPEWLLCEACSNVIWNILGGKEGYR